MTGCGWDKAPTSVVNPAASGMPDSVADLIAKQSARIAALEMQLADVRELADEWKHDADACTYVADGRVVLKVCAAKLRERTSAES